MSQSVVSGKAVDPLLAELIEEITDKLQQGEAVDLEAYLQQHAEYAEDLRQLLPALQMLAVAGSTPANAAAAGAENGLLAGVLGDFRILREIGRGGMGVVYEAEQISLRRRVALKVLPFAAMLDPRQLQRFHNEAQASACLHHNNIVPVYFVGCERGVHFYAMQMIAGQSLGQVIADLRLQIADLPKRADGIADLPKRADTPAQMPAQSQSAICNLESAIADTPPQARLSTLHSIRGPGHFHTVARLGMQAAQALDHAHELGVIHRDVKPGNLLVDVRGNLWVTDFGLAQIQGDTKLTLTGDLVGTLRYMSPEQALAKRVLVDHRTDVYSLGATLYELLTLEPLFAGSDRQELLRQIAFEEPRAPRRHNKSIPAELDTIVLKALEKNPADRYASAKELADDLERFVKDEPIRARRPSLVQRARKWSRRHRAVVWSAAIIALILTASLGWIARDWQARRNEAESRVTQALETAEQKLREGNPYDPELISAVRQAEAQLTSGAVRDELRRQVEQVSADLAMLAKLEEIRLAQATVKDDEFDLSVADTGYEQAFREYGIDVNALTVEDAAARIRGRVIGKHLAVALDNWFWARPVEGKRSALPEETRRLLQVARAADPDWWRGSLRKALVKAQEFVPPASIKDLPPATLVILGRTLHDHVGAKQAVALLRQAQAQHPGDFWINTELAWALFQMQPPEREQALRFYTAALAARPANPGAHFNVARVLVDIGASDQAIPFLETAVALHPDYARAHVLLGNALRKQQKPADAAAAWRKAIALKPAAFPKTYYNLGNLLIDQNDLAEAVKAFQKAIELQPKWPEPYCNLGRAYVNLGQFTRGLASLRRGHELGSQKPGWSYPSAAWVREAEQFVALDSKLAQIMKGDDSPRNADERIALAGLCQLPCRELYAAAERFYREAFAAEPALANVDTRYDAACAAARAGCGQGKDAAKLKAEEYRRLREQARAWLRADLNVLQERLEKQPAKQGPRVRKTMQHWQQDRDLGGVRAGALAKLPEAEGQEWQKLWQEVEDLARKAGEPQ